MPTDTYKRALDLLATKLLEDEPRLGVQFPYVTDETGAWLTMPASHSAGYTGSGWSHGNWFCGFWVGLLVAAHLQTGETRFLDLARERMQLVAQRARDGSTHDIGFIFESSAIPLVWVTGDPDCAAIALNAADRLRRRLITTWNGAYVSAWGPLDDERGRRSSAIDTMANLPLLNWAAEHADDGSFRLAAEAHACMTRDAFIRSDWSTSHAVEYDLVTGERLRAFTFQGYADWSCWTRGQAWAIYGFTETARATRKVDYLVLAENLADYYLARMGARLVPYWDFDDPTAPNCPLDSSAAAVVASAFLTMAKLHPDETTGAVWQHRGLAILDALCATCLASEPSHRGLLKHGCYSLPHRIGTDSAVLFGDWFFTEALCAAVMPGKLHPVPQRLARR
jgi:unsaturated chondroitin disaccharide hydrolase